MKSLPFKYKSYLQKGAFLDDSKKGNIIPINKKTLNKQ